MTLLTDLGAYWALEDDAANKNVLDSTVAAKDGTSIRDTNLLSNTGIINKGFLHDASTDYYSLNDASWFDFNNNNAFSFSFWWYCTTLSTTEQHVISKGGATTGYEILQYGGKIYVEFNTAQVYTAATLNLNAWNHIVVTYDGSNSLNGVNIYHNENLKDVTRSGTMADFSQPLVKLRIGAQAIDPAYYVRGKLDELGAWTRVLLSTEVASLYNAGAGLGYPFGEIGTGIKVNISDVFKDVSGIKVNIGDEWKDITKVQINIGNVWKTVFGS